MTRVWIIIFAIVRRVAGCDSLSLSLPSTEAKKCKHKLRRLHRKVNVIRLDGKQSKCMNFFTRPNDWIHSSWLKQYPSPRITESLLLSRNKCQRNWGVGKNEQVAAVLPGLGSHNGIILAYFTNPGIRKSVFRKILGFILTSWISLELSRPKQSVFRKGGVPKLKNSNSGKLAFF